MPPERFICCFPFLCIWESNGDTDKPSLLQRIFGRGIPKHRAGVHHGTIFAASPDANSLMTEEQRHAQASIETARNSPHNRSRSYEDPLGIGRPALCNLTHRHRGVSLFSQASPERKCQRAGSTAAAAAAQQQQQQNDRTVPTEIPWFTSSPPANTENEEDLTVIRPSKFDADKSNKLWKVRTQPSISRPTSEPIYDSQGFFRATEENESWLGPNEDPPNKCTTEGQLTSTSQLNLNLAPLARNRPLFPPIRPSSHLNHSRRAPAPLFPIPESPDRQQTTFDTSRPRPTSQQTPYQSTQQDIILSVPSHRRAQSTDAFLSQAPSTEAGSVSPPPNILPSVALNNPCRPRHSDPSNTSTASTGSYQTITPEDSPYQPLSFNTNLQRRQHTTHPNDTWHPEYLQTLPTSARTELETHIGSTIDDDDGMYGQPSPPSPPPPPQQETTYRDQGRGSHAEVDTGADQEQGNGRVDHEWGQKGHEYAHGLFTHQNRSSSSS